MPINKTQQYAMDVMSAVNSLFDEDNENYRYKLDDIDANAFFTGFAMAFGLTFNTMTGGSEDFIGGTHLANRLAFQYLVDHGKEIVDEAEDDE
jgi:hypothetical protein